MHTIHLAHDWLVGLRGGEWVLDRFARRYGPTVLYTLVNDNRPLTPAIDSCDVRVSFLQRCPGAAGHLRRWYLPVMSRAVDRLRVDSCDLLLSTSSAVMKGIRPPTGVPHLCYCHSPARYVWGQTDDYGHGAAGSARQLGLRMVRQRFQKWDRESCRHVTRFIANSHHTAKKIERFYDRESVVIHPPVRTEYFKVDQATPREDWYLVASALEPYKRVDLAIDVANQLGLPLKVAGSGSQVTVLQERAGPTVEFLGRVSDEHLRDMYRRARALIHPQLEDFGIIAVEAQACGCPVIAFAAGGALETVGDGCGAFFAEQRTEVLAEEVGRFDPTEVAAGVCRAHAQKFAEDRFDLAIDAEVEALLGDRPGGRVEVDAGIEGQGI